MYTKNNNIKKLKKDTSQKNKNKQNKYLGINFTKTQKILEGFTGRQKENTDSTECVALG